MVKPDGVQRGMIGEIVKRFEQKGFKLVAAKFTNVTSLQAESHYAEHKEKHFFKELIDFITSGPVFAMVWEADDMIRLSRMIIGKTKSIEALPGTIRGDFGVHTNFNLVHGSDSPESATREIKNFFSESELVNYDKILTRWI